MPLRNILTVPPGGFRYDQPLPDGAVKKFASMNLAWTLAEEIADFRKGNGLPRASAREAIDDIEAATCQRLHDDPNWCRQDKKKALRPALSQKFAAAKRVAAGARVLIEWLGSGSKPVPIEIAQKRANVCLKCEHNREGHSFLTLTGGTVRAIAEQMQAKEQLKLRVEGEERLHACGICLCPIKLKCHVPLDTILAHTAEETLNSFPKWCWMVTEQQTNAHS